MTPRRSTRRPTSHGDDLDLFPAAGAQPGRVDLEPDVEPDVEPEPAVVEEPPPDVAYGPERYPGETPLTAVSVGTLTETARALLEGAFIPLWVRGEVGDFKAHRNGHWYFTLRDSSAQIRAVVWNRDQRRIPAPPDDGMQVVAFGRPTVYAARGDLQFTVLRLDAEGDGLRRKALEKTRARLDGDGLLAPERKRALPRFPRVIAVVTSPDGAALHDIVAVLKRRRAAVQLVVVPAAVQGESARNELCAALRRVGRWGAADVVIVSRGGGGREDLSVFNDEKVARAVAACPVPTISAVGHEIDVCMCDLVADVRAPTPSAAAEAATRSLDEVQAELRRLGSRLVSGARGVVRGRRDQLRHAARDLAGAGSLTVSAGRLSLQSIAGRLHALSPLATLARGYAVPRDADGRTLSSAAAFTRGMPFELVLHDGLVPAVVRPARKEKPA